MTGHRGWNRREFVSAAALLALVLGIPAGIAVLSQTDEDEAPTDRQREVMRVVSDAVLPDTDTPGAGQAGVGDFVILALAHGLDGTRQPDASAEMPWALPQDRRQDGSLRYIDWLERTLDRGAGGDWLAKPPTQRTQALADIDAQAFAKDAGAHPWLKLKSLILTGYYTSEIGASQELQFTLVPGRYDPDLPIGPDERAWANDWTGVDFG